MCTVSRDVNVCVCVSHKEKKTRPPPHLLQRVGDVRLHLGVLSEDQTGQQGGALLGRQRAQDILEQKFCQQQLVAADLTSYAAFQLHCPAAVDVLEGLKNLREAGEENKPLSLIIFVAF